MMMMMMMIIIMTVQCHPPPLTSGHASVVEVLLGCAGIDVASVQEDEGNTPLHGTNTKAMMMMMMMRRMMMMLMLIW